MPRNTESSSSDTGVVTRSSASLIKDNFIKHLQLTVPCSVKLDKLRQSSKKLVLKNGSGYYTLTREEPLSYRIEGIKVLRTRNRSMPTATQNREEKMNRPDPKGKGFHHYSQSRESGFLDTSPGDYHKQGRFDARYSGPYRSRGRDNRFEERRHWSARGSYGNRGSRDSYDRDYNSGGSFGRRASSYPDDSIRERRMTSPESRYERVPRGDRDGSSGFQDRVGRYPDERGEKRRHQSGSSIPENSKSLVSTYRKTDVNSVKNNHTVSQNASENEDSKQSSKEPKENVLNNERTIQNHTLNKDKAGSPATSQGLSNSDSGKATQRTPNETIKPNADKHKKKGVLTLSQQIESLKTKQPKANVAEIKEMPGKKSDDTGAMTSKTGNGSNAKGSPHRTEISVPNHIDNEKSAGKGTEASSSGETEGAAASPRRVHSARKSAPTSSVSRTQKSDMLKKQALLRSQSGQSPSASTTSSTPTARMGSGETKSCRRDTDQGGPLTVEGGKSASGPTDDHSSRIGEAFTPPHCEDIVVLSDTEDSIIDISSQDKGPTEESTGIKGTSPQPSGDAGSSEGNPITSSEVDSKVYDSASTERSVPEVTSEEVALENNQQQERGDEDQEMASDEAVVTSETQDGVQCDEPEKSPEVGKIKEKALLKIKENLKKNLLKGKISPQTSSPSSRPESRSSSDGFPECPVDTTEVTSATDQTNVNKKDIDECLLITSARLENSNPESDSSFGISDAVPLENGKGLCENIGNPSEPCPGDKEVANRIAVDMVDDIQHTSKLDSLETLTSEGSTEHVADDSNHICNSLPDDCAKINCALEKPVGAEMVQTADSLPEQSDEASDKDDLSLPKVGDSIGNVDDLSDGSVDLGPNEPGDMDSIDDDLLLEDEPIIISEGYHPEPEKMDTSEIPESLDSEVSELAIARVESQSEVVLQEVDSDQPSTSKRNFAGDGEDVVEEPACKKSRTETADIIEGIESTDPEETPESDASKKPVIFTHNEWKEFAQSIKEKYEKLVQTFNQKTNVMYEAQARWQQETLSWKKSYEELECKYEHLLVQVKEKPVIEKQNVEVQTTFTHRTKLSRKKKEGTHQAPQAQASQEEAMETEQGNTSSSNASSGTPPQTTSDCEPTAAASRSNSAPAPDTQASNKPSHLESKRQVFRATLNKVMQSKMNLSGTSEGETASPGKTSSQVGAITPQTPESLEELSKEQLGSSNGSTALEAPIIVSEEGCCKESPMDTSESGNKTSDTLSETQPVTTATESMSTTGPNVAITASGTDTAASQPRETSSSKATPSNTKTSNLSSDSEAMCSRAIPSPSKSYTSTASPSKAQTQTSEKTKLPSATDSTKLPGSPKHSTGTASPKVPEASKDSSKKPGAVTDKDSSVSKSATPVKVQVEPEVIDLTDDPDPPTDKVSKQSAPSPHKQKDALPVSKHTTLTTRSPHALVNSPSVPSANAVVSRAPVVSTMSNSISASTASGTISSSPNTRQVQTSAQNLVLKNATQRSGQRTAAVPPAPQTRTGSTSGPVPSPKRTSPGVPQSISPQGNKQSSSAANLQLRNVNPPVVTAQMQGSNVRPQVVSLQHGQRQQIPAAGRVRPQSSQVAPSQALGQQRPMPTSQHAAAATLAGLQPVIATMQSQARMQGQVAIQQRLQQQQQQISLKMLQQGRQGVHQLPGAAASAAALATRQPQQWLQQPRPQLHVTSSQQQSLQVCQQIQLPTGQMQVQMVRPHVASASTTLTSSTLPTGTQIALQKQQQQQQQQLQIQAQERAHAANHAQAMAKAAREQREQEQHQQARIAAQRLQSSQLEQQQTQRAQIKKLQEEQSLVQTKAQQHQNKKRLILSQIQRGEEYQRTLRSKLTGSKHAGMNPQVYQNCQKQLQDVQEQERKLRGELSLVEKSIEEFRQKNNQLDQHLRLATGSTAARLSPQELQKHQLQQQQQQLSQQLAQRQIQQQRNQQLQQQQQVQLQQQKQQETAKIKHPAQLPDLTAVLDVPRATLFTPLPIKPVLEIKHSQEGIVLSWKADPEGGASKIQVKRYLLYAYQESESATPSTDLWKKIGAVDALPLPMACTLTHFKAGSMYHFAVCAISKHGRPGAFSNIGSINLP